MEVNNAIHIKYCFECVMIKEVEIVKRNGETQYVDWETGEELFKISDCIPMRVLNQFKKEIEKELEKEETNISCVDMLQELEVYNILIEKYKKWLKKKN